MASGKPRESLAIGVSARSAAHLPMAQRVQRTHHGSAVPASNGPMRQLAPLCRTGPLTTGEYLPAAWIGDAAPPITRIRGCVPGVAGAVRGMNYSYGPASSFA